MNSKVTPIGARVVREPKAFATGHWHRLDYVMRAGMYYGLIKGDKKLRQRFMNLVYHGAADQVYIQLPDDLHQLMGDVNNTELNDLLYKEG